MTENTLGIKETISSEKTNKSGPQTGRPNPVQLSFEQELSRFIKYVTKKAELGVKWKKTDEEAFARGSNTLFNLWNSYELRLQQSYFIHKMIATGEFLFSIKEYRIAQYQCFGRYLRSVRPFNTRLDTSSTCDLEGFKSIYLPNGLKDQYAMIVLRALLGEAICSFHVQIADDIKLKNSETVGKSITILKVLRLITQTALHVESYCWLVFNGTVHIYTICRHLMALGYSKEVLEFLLWACMCMESSVPLMTVKYLSWRSTLYSAVCHCYFDLKALAQAEAFAKRAVNKVNELEDIEKMSTSETTPMSTGTFREAKSKMQIMVFKRVVFETRKRPKGLLRPKTKPNLKDTIHQPWPRTPAERLLADVFQGSTSSQFLAILEALADPHRRTLHCEPPPVDSEDLLTDVYGELFFAGLEIIAGGGGTRHTHAMKHDTDIHPSVVQLGNQSLVELIRDDGRGVPLQSVVRFIKYAFSYEQWETFNTLVHQTLNLLKNQENSSSLFDIKTLELMLAIEPFYSHLKKLKKTSSHNALDEGNDGQGTGKGNSTMGDLMFLGDTLHSCSVEPFKSLIGHMDPNMIIDAALFLWSKCKAQFQRVVSASMEGCKFVLNDKDANKWIYLITVVHTALSWSDACTFDPVLFAEVALKLSLVLECKAGQNLQQTKWEEQHSPSPDSRQDVTADRKKSANPNITDKQSERSHTSFSNASKHSSILGLSEEGYSRGVRGLLDKARDVLFQAFEGIGRSRDSRIKLNSSGIVDVSWMKNAEDLSVDNEQDKNNLFLQNIIKALHMELLFVHHRVVVKAEDLGKDPPSQGRVKPKGSAQSTLLWESDLISSCDKNPLSKALLVMHKASCSSSLKGITGSEQQQQLMKESIELVQKAQQQDQRLLKSNTEETTMEDSLPPPILLYRSPSVMVFRPAPFESKNTKVAWYSIFARSANGSNIKVRLNDYQLPGTGEETPVSSECIMTVRGLKANQRYVFAMAAYDIKGQLIGKSIGATSRPILAAYSLPTLMAWGYLAQIAYTSGVPSIAQQACSVLWNHFVSEQQPSEEELKIQQAENNLKIRLKVLDQNKMDNSSPVLVRQFLQSIFISVDLNIRDNFLFCNSLCDNGPLYNGQAARLHECERLLLALQVAGWLNDAAMCLQAIVQVYGLLAPMVQQQIPAKPVLQVLLRCHAVLQEVPSLTRHRRQSSASDSLSHMIATMTYFVAKILQNWGEKNLSGAIVELGKKMLNIETAPDSAGAMATIQQAAAIATANMIGQPPPKTKKKTKARHKNLKGKGMDKDMNAALDSHDEELKALEAYAMKLSQKGILNRDEDELTGSEDPSILHGYVSGLRAQEAYKEVLKFKRRTRFLEFFVQVLGKAIDEGLTETCLQWTNDTMTWIIRRNEMLLANKSTIVRMGNTGIGQEDEKIKRFATAIVEFGKVTAANEQSTTKQSKKPEPDEVRMRTKQETAKPPPSKAVKSSIMSRKMTVKTKGRTEEDAIHNLAVEKLQNVLPDFWKSCSRRKKLRSVNKEELPWKVQLNVLTAGCNLDIFLDTLDNLQCFTEDGDIPMYRSTFMDPDWFSFSTSGTFIVSWSGTARGDSPEPAMGFSGSMMGSPPYASPAVTTGRTGHTGHTGHRASQGNTDTMRAGSRVTASDRESIPAPKSPLVYLGNVFSNLTRAIVLAHRGKYWTMMQNACRCLWNATNTIMIQVTSGSLRLTDDPQGETKSDIDILRGALWRPFYTAADCLMDMIVHLQEDVKYDSQLNQKHGKTKKGDPQITEISGLMGGIEDQKGGSSLRFEIPLDNLNTLDSRWIKQVILYAAEMMFYESKWERVVEVILRFNAITRSRYAESVLPMLIVAQRNLAERIEENGGPSKSQPIIKISKDTGKVDEFIIIPAEYERIEPAVHIDPIGHNVYSSSTDAFRLISVPLDINDSLMAFREALDTKHHTARALEHSRQLLLCYLAGQQRGSSSNKLVRRGSSRVGFVPAQVKPHSDVPVDHSEETFESVDDIKTYTLQSSQLAVVISSYDKTIEMLQFRQQHGLASQAMHELGNIMFHSDNIRLAYRWWAESLDAILKTSDALKTWRDIACHDNLTPSQVLLKRCGLWGCLLAAVVAAKIAQYVHTSNLGLRQECCLLSATLFKTLLCSTLPHPTADKDYALYEIGAGQEVKELIPGVDLLSDVFRSDGRSVVASLRWITEDLARARHFLTVLPLISLCLYFTSHICRDVQRTVDIRLLRARVLTDLGLFAEAVTTLFDILRGDRLPRLSMERQATGPKKKTKLSFCNSRPLNDANNVEVLNELLEINFPGNLAQLCGEHITGQVKIAHAHLLVAIALGIYGIPVDMTEDLERFFVEKAEAEAAEAEYESNTVPSTVIALGKKIGKTKKSDDTISVKSFTLVLERKLLATDTIPATAKSLLLSQAARILKGLLDSIQTMDTEDLDMDETACHDFTPTDLELHVLAKLELSQISMAKHHAVTAGVMVYSAMRALENAAVLNELDADKRSPSMFSTSPLRSVSPWPAHTDHYITSQSRQRLDARLWLTCRLILAKCLAEEDNAVGKLAGLERSATAQIGSLEHHCKQGYDEAEAFGDVEIGAEFAFLSFIESLQHGKISDELISDLEEVIVCLEQCQTLSYQGQFLLTKAVIQYGDINEQGSYSNAVNHIKEPIIAYQQAISVVLRQMVNLGERIDSHTKCPVLPLNNIYLDQLDVLVELKLRYGRALFTRDENSNVEFTQSIQHLELGLDVMRNAALQRKSLEAQLLFSLGQAQRQLVTTDNVSARSVANTYLDAIKASYTSDHNLTIIKRSYLEIAITYLLNTKQAKQADEQLAAAEEPNKTSKTQQKPDKANKKEPKQKQRKPKENKLKEIEKEKRAAWSAVRAASLVSMAQNQFSMMCGDPEISVLKISQESGEMVPDFALIDLLGTDGIVPSDTASLVGKNGVVTMATTINDSDIIRVTWIHFLSYLSFLRRQCSYKALGVDVDLDDATSSPLFSIRKAQKLSKVHEFLRSELEPYGNGCCGVYPGEGLSLVPGLQLIVTQPTQLDLDTKPAAVKDTFKQKSVSNGFSTSSAKEFEISICWGKVDFNGLSSRKDKTMVVMAYGLNSKAFNMSSTTGTANLKTGFCSLSLADVQAVHEGLMSTLEMAESDLQPTTQQPSTSSPITAKSSRGDLSVPGTPDGKSTNSRKRRSMGIRALSGKQRRDDAIRAKLKDHVTEISALLSKPLENVAQDVPFEVSLKNVSVLEAMFDPSRGLTCKVSEAFFNWFSSLLADF